MTKRKRSSPMPRDASELRFVGDVRLEAAAGEDQPALVHVAAYNGGVMTVTGFGPVVLDVEGIESPDRVPLLADHENRIHAVLGSGAAVRGDGRAGRARCLERDPPPTGGASGRWLAGGRGGRGAGHRGAARGGARRG